MSAYRMSDTYRAAVLRATRQRAAMRYRVAALRDTGRKPLAIKSRVFNACEIY